MKTAGYIQIAAGLSFVGPGSAYLYNQTISTKYGLVQGVPALNASCCSYLEGYESVTVWRGIPFAADTGGANRFRPPQPAAPWNTTLIASDFGPPCPAGTTPPGSADPNVDENCLNLNIWSSANSTSEKRSVMIWSYPAGSNNAWAEFDGGGMALQDIVFVNYNYRTGPYGWSALPELYEESGNLTTGNYGFLDQVAALKWVHENIAAFGGDPEHITAVGQSAGSAEVYHFVNSPLAKGLIVGAIAESGIRDPRDPASRSLAEGYNNMSTSVNLTRTLMEELNITTVEEYRNVTAAQINDASGFAGFSVWRSTLDGYAMTEAYWDELMTGPANDVPVVTGNTKDESGAAYGATISVADWQAEINETYGSLASEFLAAYPCSNSTQCGMQSNLLARDISLIGSYNFASLWSKTATSPFYTYYWDHEPTGSTQGASHMSEIMYVLNNLYGSELPLIALDYDIARTLNAYWANFIKTGNPNTGDSYARYENGTLDYWRPNEAGNATVFHLSPPAPLNPNGLPVGYQQVSAASSDVRFKLIEKYLVSRTDETI
ncbi:alpha/beta-hydrolase [Xylariaceae sp. FL0255]|nr:alpha/beta-hydrolase [Xylariaceae sp. FL0255]